MSGFDIRAFISAAASASAGGPAAPGRLRRRTVPTAEAAAPVVVRRSYSPAILAGVARFLEFTLVVVAGVVVHQDYLSGTVPLVSSYLLATLGTALLTTIVFQSIGAYTVSA